LYGTGTPHSSLLFLLIKHGISLVCSQCGIFNLIISTQGEHIVAE